MADIVGYIYVLTNPAMPGIVKIGCSANSFEDRVKDLSASTSVPLAFECHFAAQVENYASKERTLHQLFGDQRVNPKREFFRVAPEKVVLAIRMGQYTDVTPGRTTVPSDENKAQEKALDSDVKRRSNIRLDAIGIVPGTRLTLSRDENITATVVPGNKVEYEGQQMSLSAAALLALRKLGSRTPAASGSDYWMSDGETLDEIRVRIETQAVHEDEQEPQ